MEPSELGELDFTKLAAARAALERQKERRGILTAAIVEVLAVRGPLQSQEICRVVNRMWRTRTVRQSQVDRALESARRAGLVLVQQEDAHNRWAVSATTLAETQQDGAFVALVWAQFELGVRLRLEEGLPSKRLPIAEERVGSLSRHLFAAIAAAADSTSIADQTRMLVAPGSVELSPEVIRKELRNRFYWDTELRLTLLHAAVDALNPLEEFGNQLLRLLLVANVLHIMLTQRDLAGVDSLSGAKILLDTSALYLYIQESGRERVVLRELVETSRRAQVEVSVPSHVVAEWEASWQLAGRQLLLLEAKGEDEALRHGGYVHLRNDILQAYYMQLEQDPQLTWTRFERMRNACLADVRSWGAAAGVSADLDEEGERLRRAITAQLRSPVDRKRPARESEHTARADAFSCAVVAGWRKQSSLGSIGGWFIGTDASSQRIYAALRVNDPLPIVMTPHNWLVFVASFLGEAAEDAVLAKVVSDATSRPAFLSLAATYELEAGKAEYLAELIALAEAADPAVRELLHEQVGQFFGWDPQREAEELRRQDAARREQRLVREAEVLARQETDWQQRLEAIREQGRREGEEKAHEEARHAAAKTQAIINKEQHRTEEAIADANRERRLRQCVVIGAMAVVATVALGWAHILTSGWLALAFVTDALVFLYLVDYVRERVPSVTVIVLALTQLLWVTFEHLIAVTSAK